MIRRVITILVVLFGSSGGAVAAYHPPIDFDRLDGREYLYLCEAGMESEAFAEPFSDTVWRLHECARFVQKLRNKLRETSVHGYTVCIPNDVAGVEIVFISLGWLEEHPEETEKTADEIVSAALFREWPCAANSLSPEQ